MSSGLEPFDLPLAAVPYEKFLSGSRGGDPMAVDTLGNLLRNRHNTPALVAGYWLPGEEFQYRLRKADIAPLAAKGLHPEVRLLGFDIDRPKKEDGTKDPWPDVTGPEEILGKIAEAGLLPTAFYSTVHGVRAMWVLKDPVTPIEAERIHAHICRQFEAIDLPVDPATTDWTRLYTLPFVRKASGLETWTHPAVFLEEFPHVQLDVKEILNDLAAEEVELKFPPLRIPEDCPSPNELQALVYGVSVQGRPTPTAFAKAAKKLLEKSLYLDLIFNEAAPAWPAGERNDRMFRLVGHVVTQLYGRVEDLTVEHIMALVAPAALKLPPSADTGEDYFSQTWEMVCRQWESRYEEQIVEAKTYKEQEDAALGGFREQCRASGTICKRLADARGMAEADYMREHLIAVAAQKGETYLMSPDGYFTKHPVAIGALHGAIKHIGLEDLYGIHDGDGALLPRDEIMKLRAFGVGNVSIKLGLHRGQLTNLEGDMPDLELPSYYRIEHEPVWSDEVDTFLKLFAGDGYVRLCDWLAFAQDIYNPICALSLSGPNSTGKTFLGEILGAMFGPGSKNSETVFGPNNGGLTENPVIHIDEGIHHLGQGKALDEVFRTYVSGGTISISEKYAVTKQAEVYPRVLITANNLDALQAAVAGRDLDDSSFEALAARVLHLEAQPEARAWLSEFGGRTATRNWIVGDCTALKHLSYLYHHRPERSQWAGQGRLLVEGARQSQVLEEMRFGSPQAEAALRAILTVIAAGKGKATSKAVIVDPKVARDAVLVNTSGLLEYIEHNLVVETRNSRLNLRVLGDALRTLSMGGRDQLRPRDAAVGRGRWNQIDPQKVLIFAARHGFDYAPVMELCKNAYGEAALADMLRGLEDT